LSPDERLVEPPLMRNIPRLRVDSDFQDRRAAMSGDNLLTRREFTLESALVMLAGVAITITGCGSDSPPTNPTPPATDKTGTVSTDGNHTHTGATITERDRRGTAERTGGDLEN
jgi:hypothetical protein